MIFLRTNLIHLPQVTSTNDEARRLAAEGAVEGTVVRTDHQTAGRGRYGRTWFASPGQNVLLSVVLRPELPAERLGLIALAGAVAIMNTIQELTGLHATLKWPNDVFIDGRKVSGMLLEATHEAGEGAAPDFVIAGIGVNINQRDFPPELDATSLMLKVGRRISCDEFADRLMAHFGSLYASIFDDGGAQTRAAFVARMTGIGEQTMLYFHGGGAPVAGRLLGVSTDGGLELELQDGHRRTFHAGEVTAAPGPHTDHSS